MVPTYHTQHHQVRVARNRMGQGGTDRRAMKKLTDVVEALENRGKKLALLPLPPPITVSPNSGH